MAATGTGTYINPLVALVARAGDPDLDHTGYVALLRTIVATVPPKSRRPYLTAAAVQRRKARDR